AVDAKRAFTNDNAKLLLPLGDNILTVTGLAEMLQKAGEKMVTVSSGSTGSALLTAPRAAKGIGVVIHPDFDGAVVPANAVTGLFDRFGPAPKKGGARVPYDESMVWGMTVLRDYVLPEMKPRVALAWLTEPDHIQHGTGPGSPASVSSIRKDDEQIGLLLKKLAALGLAERTNVYVLSDHGFGHTVHTVNVNEELRTAGLAAADSDEVVVASSGQAVALHVKNHDRAKIAAIVEFLQKQPWCGVIFTAAGRGGAAHEGSIRGTFALEQVHLGG